MKSQEVKKCETLFCLPFPFSSTRWARPVLFEISEFVEQFHVFYLLDILQVQSAGQQAPVTDEGLVLIERHQEGHNWKIYKCNGE